MEFARRSDYCLQSCTSRFPLEPVQTDIVEIVDCGLWRTSVLHTALTVTGRKLPNLILAQQQSIAKGGFGLKHRSIWIAFKFHDRPRVLVPNMMVRMMQDDVGWCCKSTCCTCEPSGPPAFVGGVGRGACANVFRCAIMQKSACHPQSVNRASEDVHDGPSSSFKQGLVKTG